MTRRTRHDAPLPGPGGEGARTAPGRAGGHALLIAALVWGVLAWGAAADAGDVAARRDAELLARLGRAFGAAGDERAPQGASSSATESLPPPPRGSWEEAWPLEWSAAEVAALLGRMAENDAALPEDLAAAAGCDVAGALRRCGAVRGYLLVAGRDGPPWPRAEVGGIARTEVPRHALALALFTEDPDVFGMLAHADNTTGPVELTGVRRARLRHAIAPLFPIAPLVGWNGRVLVVATEGRLMTELLAVEAAGAAGAEAAGAEETTQRVEAAADVAPSGDGAARPPAARLVQEEHRGAWRAFADEAFRRGGRNAEALAFVAALEAGLSDAVREEMHRIVTDLETIHRANRMWAMLRQPRADDPLPTLEELDRLNLLIDIPVPPGGGRYEQAARWGAYPRHVPAAGAGRAAGEGAR